MILLIDSLLCDYKLIKLHDLSSPCKYFCHLFQQKLVRIISHACMLCCFIELNSNSKTQLHLPIYYNYLVSTAGISANVSIFTKADSMSEVGLKNANRLAFFVSKCFLSYCIIAVELLGFLLPTHLS